MESIFSFPEEIRQTAGVVCEGGKIVPRNVLVAEVANELYRLYEGLSQKTFMEDYKKWSNVLGKEVRFSTGYANVPESEGQWQYGRAVDIDEDGGLVVLVDGKEKVLRTGEITLRVNE